VAQAQIWAGPSAWPCFGNRGGPEPRLKRVDRHQIARRHAHLSDLR